MANFIKSPCDEGVIRSAPGTISCHPDVGRWVLVATILGSSMAFIDGTVVNVALPVLQVDLNATTTDVQWIVEAYSLFLAALILVGGTLGDHFGRRRIFATGIAIFTLASVWCGLSPNVLQLILARAIQGIGGGICLLFSCDGLCELLLPRIAELEAPYPLCFYRARCRAFGLYPKRARKNISRDYPEEGGYRRSY